MKRSIYLFTAAMLIAMACKRNGQKADAYGNFEVDEINISSEVPGKIVELNTEEGEQVKAGQLLAQLDTTQQFLQKKSLKAKKAALASKTGNVYAEIKVVEQQIAVLEKEQQRVKRLLEEEAATGKQLDDIEGQIAVLKERKKSIETQNASVVNELRSMEFQVKALDDQIDKSFITAPQDAIVLVKSAERGEVASPGKTLFKLASMNYLYLRAYVSGAQLNDIALNQQVRVEIDSTATTNKALPGEIVWISEKAEFTPKIIQTKEERVNLVYAVKVRVKNNGALKIGMPGEMWIDKPVEG